jgi:hypothetical protein
VTGFETLVYTDCRPGESVTGTAGMGFRARSPGADAAAMDVVKRHLLYEAPENWMRQSRPPPDYPRSYAHTAGRYLASARGVYLGREVSGARQGNHLTHAIVAADHRAYGLVRPAQLLDAPFWINPPGPVRDCDPINGRLPRGPFDAHEAQTFVASEFRGAELLMSLVTALEQPNRRVLFIARDSGEVLRWLATATLLLPQAEAVRIGFKIFTTNPAFATQQVLAIHPDWNSSAARVDNDLGYQIFDLVERDWTHVQPSPRASRWVRLFLGEDPFDVVDAVELAATVGRPGVPSTGTTATAVAAAAVLGHPPRDGTEAEAAVEWLRTGPELTVDVYGARLFEVLMGAVDELPQPVVDLLFTALTERRLGTGAVGIQALFRAELRRAADTGAAGPTGRTAPADAWDAARRHAAEAEVAAAIRRAGPAHLDAILRVATRFGVPVQHAAVEPQVRAFVEAWADDPGRRYDPSAWPNGADLAAALRTVLNDRLGADLDGTVLHRIGTDWWSTLPVSAVPPADDLDVALIAARMVLSLPTERERFVDDAIERCRTAPDPADAFTRTVAAMWRRDAPRLADAQKIRRAAPRGVRIPAAALAPWPNLLRDNPTAHPDAIAALLELHEGGLLGLDESMQRLLRENVRVDELIEQIRTADPKAVQAVENLRPAEAASLELRREVTVDALVACRRPTLAFSVVEKVPGLARDYLAKVENVAHQHGTAAAILQAFCLYSSTAPPGPLAPLLDKITRVSLESTVHNWVGRAPTYEVERAEDLAKRLDGNLPQLWRSMVKSIRGRRLFGGR